MTSIMYTHFLSPNGMDIYKLSSPDGEEDLDWLWIDLGGEG